LIESLIDDAVALGGHASYVGPTYAACICRPVAITRAIGNLLDNAIKYGGVTVVGLGGTPEEIVITIDDDGPGIPPEALEKVFEPFTRLDPARPSVPGHIGLASANPGGVGLGLTIARNVILAHGGDIALNNRAAGGLRVIVGLPHRHQVSSPAGTRPQDRPGD
jgi:signal transduction histidine kinase